MEGEPESHPSQDIINDIQLETDAGNVSPKQLRARLMTLAKATTSESKKIINPKVPLPRITSYSALKEDPKQYEVEGAKSLKRPGADALPLKSSLVKGAKEPLPPIANKKTKFLAENNSDAKKKRDVLTLVSLVKKDDFKGFFYLKPAFKPVTEKQYMTSNLYDLEGVDYVDMERSHGFVTLSKQGVTYFDAVGHGEFTPLEEWLAEYHAFHKLQDIPFFGQYKARKYYEAWRKTIRHSKIERARKVLSESSFLCDPILAQHLIHAKKVLDGALKDKSIFSVKPDRTFQLADFMKENKEWMVSLFDNDLRALQQTLRSIVETATLASLAHKGFHLNWDSEKQAIVDSQSATKLTFTEQGARRNECKRLQHFVKLVDYLTIETVRGRVIESTWNLLRCLFNQCNDEHITSILNELQCQTEETAVTDNLLQSKFPMISTLSMANFDPDYFPYLVTRTRRLKMGVEEYVQIKSSVTVPMESLRTPQTALFHVSLKLHTETPERQILSHPVLSEFTDSFRSLFKALLDLVDSLSLLTNSVKFLDPSILPGVSNYTVRGLEQSEYEGGIQISALIMDSAFFMECLGRIWVTLHSNYRHMEDWIRTLEDIRQMWVTNERFVLLNTIRQEVGDLSFQLASANSKSVEGGIYSFLQQLFASQLSVVDPEMEALGVQNAPVSLLPLAATVSDDTDKDGNAISAFATFFSSSLKKFSSQMHLMEELPGQVMIDNVMMDLVDLKKVLVPNPQRCLKDIVTVMPDVARDKNELLLNEIQTWMRLVRSPPAAVEYFIEYLVWLEKVDSWIPLVERCQSETSQFYAIMEAYKIPLAPTDVALYQTLAPNVRQIKEILDIALEIRDDNIQKRYVELEHMMAAILSEVAEIRNHAQEAMILDPASDALTVISVLDGLATQVERIENLKTRYENWGKLFKNNGLLKKEEEAPSTDKISPASSGHLRSQGDGEFTKRSHESVASAATEPEEVHLLYDPRKYEELVEAKQEILLKKTLWACLKEWYRLSEEWTEIPFDTLDTEQLNERILYYTKTIYSLEKGLPPNDVVARLKTLVEKYRAMYPTIIDLRNPALKARHWDKIQDITAKDLVHDNNFTLKYLISINIFDYKDEIGAISGQASSEASLEEMLSKMVTTWNSTEFIILNYKDYKDVFILGGIDEIQTLLEDSQVTMATIKSSRHLGPIKNDVEKMDKALSLFAETLEAWMTCQRSWLYLESVFTAPDIQRQLPDESKMFGQVDRSWKDIMRKVSRNPNCLKAGTTPGLLEVFNQNNASLDKIQKCLEDYLESKRLLFPRFYFLSNDELLEILSQTRNPLAVQPHLSKCFDGIKSLDFNAEDARTMEISAMVSPEGEKVAFSKTLKARGNVEAWLCAVEESMYSILKKQLKASLADYSDEQRIKWVLSHIGQLVLTANQILWTREVTTCFESKNPNAALNALKTKWVKHLNQLAALVRGPLTKIQRAILGALVTLDVHNRDIIQSLIAAHVVDAFDFEWIKQLRYYWTADSDECKVKMSSSTYEYGYEYLGCPPRLVITQLTDRCYLTLTGALQLNLGGSPMGPAGTGKTETVKDLAKALAKQCVVFNCSDGMDYKMTGKMFAGLAQSGSWCCFDEFNRIDIEVLSVVAQQVLTIKNAKDMKVPRFMFEGREIRLIETCAAFITMNPGYAGRSELPDNLKALFRPIAMMIPDYGLIAEIMLFSEGFENAKVLSGKVVNLYKLCSEQLSQQDHYDFGMRAVKSVLVMAGSVKRSSPTAGEDAVLMRALKDSNLPKFLKEDVILFEGILSDLFPGTVLSESNVAQLTQAIHQQLDSAKLEIVDDYVTRIIQLWDTMKIRHGVMLVGPTGAGKTTAYTMLQKAMGVLAEKDSNFKAVKKWVLNPKCISMSELYGEFNLDTMEWKDGLMGTIFRAQVSDPTDTEKWTVLDGPVDALWIENMNTVLDDNKLLTLINGERIKMSPLMHMLFEVQDLAVASPATVSRCGMVYMDTAVLGWRSSVKTWVKDIPMHVPAGLTEFIWTLFDTYVDKGIEITRLVGAEYIPTSDLNLVTTLCRYMTSFFNRTEEIDFRKPLNDLKSLFGYAFLFSFTWAFGGNLKDGKHDAFDTALRELFDQTPIGDVQIPMSSSHSIFSYYVDLKRRSFSTWEELVPSFKYSPAVPFIDIYVPTADSVKASTLLESLMINNYPVLLSGLSGVGKSVLVQDLLSKLSRDRKFLPVYLNFSAQTSSLQTQQTIEFKMEKKRKNLLGAPISSSKVAIFVDDLNMPKPDTFGSQPPLELLRQLVEFNGFYDRETLTWKDVQDFLLVAAAAPPGGGRNPMSHRLTRHFTLVNVPAQNETTLIQIFKAILEGFLKPFTTEVRSLCDATISTAVELYRRMSVELLPTPNKSHYTFNLRDLSRVIQGLTQVKPGNIQTKADMVNLFYHEVSRIFHDRLVNAVDRGYFNNILSGLVEINFTVSLKDQDMSDIVFGHFSKREVPKEDRVYVQIPDTPAMVNTLDEYLEEYNVTRNKDVRLIFFKDARKHLARIVRILSQPRGNALLIGVSGTGKQSLSRLAAHILEYDCHQIELTKNYGDTEWKEDLRQLYRKAGLSGKPVMFLIADTQIKKETFLEDINSIMNTGEVPNLFEMDEREAILGELRQAARDKGLPETRDAVSAFFISRVRENLHIVFATSPVGEVFRYRCRMFPSLVNCTTIDWFDEWPAEALLAVSKRSFEFVDVGSDVMKDKLAQACVGVHSSVQLYAAKFYAELKRRYYTTPTSYLELISLYVSMLQEKRKELVTARDTLKNGLNKLFETNDLVAKMQGELELLGPELKKKAQDVEALMVKIAQDQETADQVRKVVQEEEAVVRVKAAETEAIASEAKKDLDLAMPALDAAYKALDALDKKDIAELKVFTKPPELVLLVMEAICILFKIKPDWDNSKKLLSDSSLMKRMQEYDKDNIPEAITKKLKKYIDTPNFNPEAVEKVSKACKSMSMWVIALDIYSRVYREVEPKRKTLEAAQANLDETQAKLAEKTGQLQAVEKQLEKLKATYESSIKEKKMLADKAQETTDRLGRAGKLITALADEQVRWTESVARLESQLAVVIGDMFLGAASIAYLGPFTSQYRQMLVDLWISQAKELGIPIGQKFSLSDQLCDPATMREWNIQGLPADALSMDNGVLVKRSRRWPLLIDPQGQAGRWIKNLEGNTLKILKLNDPKLMRSLESAVRLGHAVLLEDVPEQLDPLIEPLLAKQTIRQQGRLMIKLGDNLVEYDKNFRLYLTTKMANPHFLPEVCIKVTVINFTVTRAGLQGQLLADVVKLERAELEEQRNALIVNIANDKNQLKDIEEKILRLLYVSKGNILDDEELIDTLNQSKVTSGIIKDRVLESEKTERDINLARDKYSPVAVRGSILYFSLSDLAEMDPMYQFSLKYFKSLFNQCIVDAEKNTDLIKRIEILCNKTTFDIFMNVSRGLFDKHKLIFAFIICCEILKERGEINALEWNYLLRGATTTLETLPPKPPVNWVTQNVWQSLNLLSETIKEFAESPNDLSLYPSDWDEFANAETPFYAKVPWHDPQPMSDFKKLILVKTLREEKTVSSIVEFVGSHLGKAFIEMPPLDLAQAFKDTNAQTPLLFILSPGSDPVTALLKLAGSAEFNMSERVHMISLGQGQGVIAESLIKHSTQKGDWVFLQNCHLAASWMPRLETLVKDLSANPVDANFRLFLSCMPTQVFPVSVLQDSVKITNEPPKGLKANLAKTFAEMTSDMYDDAPPQGALFKKLVFGLGFFNAVIHERKKFGPLGWNILYDWSNSDLEVSIKILYSILSDSNSAKGNIPWDALRYLTGDISFGGRVTDDWDRRTLSTLLNKYYTASILQDYYKFSPSGKYYAPADCSLQETRQYIDALPFSEDPSVFGMHENANISYQIQDARRILRTVLDVQPQISVAGTGKTTEEAVLDKASRLLDGLPEQFDLYKLKHSKEELHTRLFARDTSGRMQNALSTVLLQELERFNRLLGVIQSSLVSLQRAIQGFVAMSADLEKLFASLLNNQVPELWASVAYPSLKALGEWYKDLKLRVAALQDWINIGQPNCFWLSGFFFPQGFLTGVLQNHARKYNIPIDSLSFSFELTEYEASTQVTQEQANQSDGAYVYGLFVEAARWDRVNKTLEDAYPSEMYSPMPVMRMIPTIQTTATAKFYLCPLYKTAARAGTLSTTGHSTNFVLAVALPSVKTPEYWIARGTAMLCQLSD